MQISSVGHMKNQPTSGFGQLFGGLCPLFGVFVLSLPIPIVVNSFVTCYRNRMWRTEVRQRKEQLLKEGRHSNMLLLQQNFLKTIEQTEGRVTSTLVGRKASHI